MQSTEKDESKKQKTDYEKIAAYFAIAGVIYMFWQSQMSMQKEILDIRNHIIERITACEKDIDHLVERFNEAKD